MERAPTPTSHGGQKVVLLLSIVKKSNPQPRTSFRTAITFLTQRGRCVGKEFSQFAFLTPQTILKYLVLHFC